MHKGIAKRAFKLKFTLAEDLPSEQFVCEYICRPPKADIFYEDMIKQCVFYGCPILIENNRLMQLLQVAKIYKDTSATPISKKALVQECHPSVYRRSNQSSKQQTSLLTA